MIRNIEIPTDVSIINQSSVEAPGLVMYNVESFLELVGLEIVAEQFGVWATFLMAVAFMVLLGGVTVGGVSWLSRVGEASKSHLPMSAVKDKIDDAETDAEVVSKIEETGDELLNEAVQQLQRDGKDLTGENISAKLDEIKSGRMSGTEGPMGVLDEKGDRAPVAKMNVAPAQIEPHRDRLTITPDVGESYEVRTMFISAFPSRVQYGWLEKLYTAGLETDGAHVRTSMHVFPRATDKMIDKLNNQAANLWSTINRKKKKGNVDTIEEKQQAEDVEKLRRRLSEGSTELFDVGFYLHIHADDKQSLNEATDEIKQFFSKKSARVTTLFDRQLDGYRTGAPVGQDLIRKTQTKDIESLETMFNFMESSSADPEGVLFGFRNTDNNPEIINRFSLSGHNMLISGKIGSGKSYFAKLALWRRMMMDAETEAIIVDPVGGFGEMVEAMGGQIITIDDSTTINPLEIKEERASAEGDENLFKTKLRAVMGMFDTHFGEDNLTKGERGVLRQAIKFAYLEKGITTDPRTHSNESPIIQDVIDILREMANGKRPSEFLDVDEDNLHLVGIDPDREISEGTLRAKQNHADQLILGLEEFTPGGQRANLNGHTNINMDARVVQFNLENVVDANNAPLIMHIMLDFLFQRTKASQRKSLVYVDEAHYLNKEESSMEVLNTFIRHSRHYQTGVTLISQTVDEYMHGMAKEIYDQMDIKVLMRHEDLGEEAEKSLGLSPNQRQFILSATAGNDDGSDFAEGLLMTSDSTPRRMRIFSNQFEHHVVDNDAMDPWSLLYSDGSVGWDSIPPQKRKRVIRELGISGWDLIQKEQLIPPEELPEGPEELDMDVWSLLYAENVVSWETVPDHKKSVVSAETDTTSAPAI